MGARQGSSERLPDNYQLIYDVIREAGAGVHLTTNDLYLRASSRRPGIGISTVYRGVQRLRDLGLIDEILLPGADSAVYEPTASPHAHFRCTKCGSLSDVAYELPQRTITELSKRTGAHISEATVTLHGLCQGCCAA
ncbi:MAG: transcriptional repressor [Candidatus Eremiobacteraeota bacterium]|nr:transcriptional repressor [Candidatus Eremiobacteraeota bacterium]MBV9648014.1 transcriptional repressor [Candidatus Eremiobacteraeota bacterium]